MLYAICKLNPPVYASTSIISPAKYRPFIIFDREQKAYMNMNSRLKTLVEKFDLKNRTFEGKITEDNLNHDYTLAFKILKEERKKSMLFLKNALDYPSRDGE